MPDTPTHPLSIARKTGAWSLFSALALAILGCHHAAPATPPPPAPTDSQRQPTERPPTPAGVPSPACSGLIQRVDLKLGEPRTVAGWTLTASPPPTGVQALSLLTLQLQARKTTALVTAEHLGAHAQPALDGCWRLAEILDDGLVVEIQRSGP